MPKITFMPSGLKGEVQAGVSILDAAIMLGVKIDLMCGAQGQCRTCRVSVEKGMSNLSPMDAREEQIIPRPTPIHPFRLACQTKILAGDIVVTPKPLY
jgi:uncharacterized 2Fe-2S/4Fe-4S cluster protein (DUF4445 family)